MLFTAFLGLFLPRYILDKAKSVTDGFRCRRRRRESERQVAHPRGQTSQDLLPSKDVNVRKYGRKKAKHDD